MLRWAKINEV